MNPRAVIDLLQRYESRNITFIEPDGSWPIVWKRAEGMWVWDENGKRYLDFTAAFGVAAAGHAHPRVVRAGQRQLAALPHAMGDVHPHALKARLARELSRLTFERWSQARANRLSPPASHGKTIFCNSGFEAVEAALKTAMLATRKPGVIAFQGAYHGLGYGALNATHRDMFRLPFKSQLREFAKFVPFPSQTEELPALKNRIRALCRRQRMGAILVEPVQTRGGVNVPPPEFLPMLRALCDDLGLLLVLDEIYTGFGRTGKWFACEHAQVEPDLICLGKALTGGFPLSVCVGRADLMDAAWPVSHGEAIHTSTFLGNPVGCAMALAQIAEIERRRLPEKSEAMGNYFRQRLARLAAGLKMPCHVRGLGLLLGLELFDKRGKPATEWSLLVVKRMLHRGFILLPEGEFGNVIGFTPPLVVNRAHIDRLCDALEDAFAREDTR